MRLSSNLTPCRITDVFITSDEEGALLLRKRKEDINFRINASAAYIWQLCDGSTNIGQIAKSIKQFESATIETFENEVSDSISGLFSIGLLELKKIKLKPFATIAFSDFLDDLSSLHLFFIHLFGAWFDLKVVRIMDGPDVYIQFGRQGIAEVKASLSIFVSEQSELPEEGFDFIFTSLLDTRIAPEINIVLPECDASGVPSILMPDDWKKLTDILGEPETGRLNATPAEVNQHSNSEVKKKLTIGMATYDDYDGVYFSVQSIRMYHPEVTDETEILIIDNNPAGPCSESLKLLESSIPGYRYVAVDEVKGTAVRDFIFREANTEYVMCIDSHVFIEAGGIRKLIDYFEEHPDTPDLLQGPLIGDGLKSISTHFEPAWRQGMFGVWWCDDRGKERENKPFDIPMQGMGLAACRKSAWPGYNPLFHGFCVEEGYIHEKFRQAGGRTLCLPFLRWLHRFERPLGAPYENRWEDRIRNYLIAFDEVGEYGAGAIEHFSKILNPEIVQRVIESYQTEKQKDGKKKTAP